MSSLEAGERKNPRLSGSENRSTGLGAILWGLAQMQQAGRRRDKEIDEIAANMRESTRVVGQALARQGQAMTQAFTQQGQALARQGEVLAELLRRTA